MSSIASSVRQMADPKRIIEIEIGEGCVSKTLHDFYVSMLVTNAGGGGDVGVGCFHVYVYVTFFLCVHTNIH